MLEVGGSFLICERLGVSAITDMDAVWVLYVLFLE